MNAESLSLAAIVLSPVSFILAAVAYWRSGGKQDVRAVQRELEMLRAKQQQLAESVSQAIETAYALSREHLATARENLRKLRHEAVEGLEKQTQAAQEQLETLAARLEQGAKSAVSQTVAVAQSAEHAVTKRVRRLEARVTILQAKSRATRAAHLAKKRDFANADDLLREAVFEFDRARQILGDDHAYAELIGALKHSLHEAAGAIRAQVEVAFHKAELALRDADRLISRLEVDETAAAR
jgi:hypothetical protein